MSFENLLSTASQLETPKKTIKTNTAHRKSYHGTDWAPFCFEIDLERDFQINSIGKNRGKLMRSE